MTLLTSIIDSNSKKGAGGWIKLIRTSLSRGKRITDIVNNLAAFEMDRIWSKANIAPQFDGIYVTAESGYLREVIKESQPGIDSSSASVSTSRSFVLSIANSIRGQIDRRLVFMGSCCAVAAGQGRSCRCRG